MRSPHFSYDFLLCTTGYDPSGLFSFVDPLWRTGHWRPLLTPFSGNASGDLFRRIGQVNLQQVRGARLRTKHSKSKTKRGRKQISKLSSKTIFMKTTFLIDCCINAGIEGQKINYFFHVSCNLKLADFSHSHGNRKKLDKESVNDSKVKEERATLKIFF